MAVRALHVTDAQQLAKEKPIDIAFVCMKSYDTAWATTLISQYLASDGYVVSLQNCINEPTVAGIVGWGKTLGCIASSITVNLPEPGLVHRGAAKHGAAHTATLFKTLMQLCNSMYSAPWHFIARAALNWESTSQR